jgi:hypothetical protein
MVDDLRHTNPQIKSEAFAEIITVCVSLHNLFSHIDPSTPQIVDIAHVVLSANTATGKTL